MSYIVYNTRTTGLVASYKTKGYALRKASKNADWAVAEYNDYYNNIVKTKKVKSLMSGKEVEISVNTPLCCDPSSETYWSM